MISDFDFSKGTTPLLLSMPHASDFIPHSIRQTMRESAHSCPDRDRYVDRLYDFAPGLGASTLKANFARYVIDLNRDMNGTPLYSARRNTELCPLTTFDDEEIYNPGFAPDREEIRNRINLFWLPYHQKLASELTRIRDQYGVAILFEAHTIRSHVPRFYENQIPDLNLGTDQGQSSAPELLEIAQKCLAPTNYTLAINEIFSGGFITRTFGKPSENIHAVQLELTWQLYMDEETGAYDPDRASKLRSTLEPFIKALIDWAETQKL
jgi:N-formylglutamate deformylase